MLKKITKKQFQIALGTLLMCVIIQTNKKCPLQAALMISLIWKYYSEPVTVLPSKWLAPLERLVAFPTGVAGEDKDLAKPQSFQG